MSSRLPNDLHVIPEQLYKSYACFTFYLKFFLFILFIYLFLGAKILFWAFQEKNYFWQRLSQW